LNGTSFSDAEAAGYYRRAVFCLQPHGDTPTRSSFYDAIAWGCINVMFDKKVHFPFRRCIKDWEHMTYFIPLDAVLGGRDAVDVLKKISPREIEDMQRRIERVRRSMMYSLAPRRDNVRLGNVGMMEDSDDAFSLAIKDALDTGMERFGLPNRVQLSVDG